MSCYQADAEAAGATVVLHTPVLEAIIAGNAIQLKTGGSQAAELEADLVVNAAGLDAWDFSARVAGLAGETIPLTFSRQEYFALPAPGSPSITLCTRCRSPADLVSTCRSIWAGRPASVRTSSGSIRLIIRLIRRGHAASMQPFAVIGRHFPMVR